MVVNIQEKDKELIDCCRIFFPYVWNVLFLTDNLHLSIF